jgi:hypothetical protein
VKNGSINTDSVYRIGGNTVLSVRGIGNSFVGTNSGFSNITGSWNTANGGYALYFNTEEATIPQPDIKPFIPTPKEATIPLTDIGRFIPTPQDTPIPPTDWMRFITTRQGTTIAAVEVMPFIPTP